MLSHLRFHRRGPSHPASPRPEQPAADAAAAHHDAPHSTRAASPRPDAPSRSPRLSQKPPTLPPIARVASTGSDHSFTLSTDPPPPPARAGPDPDSNTGFIGGAALENYRRAAQASQSSDSVPAVTSQLPDSQLSRTKPPPPPIDTGLAARPAAAGGKQSKSSSFVTPTDLQQGSAASTGKRPLGSRFFSDSTSHGPGPSLEPQRGRKGLPFLKNPVSSLLMRRKASQSAAETQPPTPSYDPSIRGTRVHDFSAPRPKKTTTTPSPESAPAASAQVAPPKAVATADRGGPPDAGPPAPADPARPAQPDTKDGHADGNTRLGSQEEPPSGNPSLESSVPSAPPKDEVAASLRSSSSATSQDAPVAPLPDIGSSVRTAASRRQSASRSSKRASVASAVPKHMKSTSSRFSFDMIGAAEQEKLLEERHRQRQQEKKMAGDSGYIDAKYDDFDGESFDYDAMMDDDGLEERIPGVNADLEDEEDLAAAMDPDNDQENFAGFVFQRSDPASALTSPHTPAVMPTPRDANGNVIGFATTKDGTPALPASTSPVSPAPTTLSKPDVMPGLGIHEPEADATGDRETRVQHDQPSAAKKSTLDDDDDLYFDDGLADELDFEHDGTFFDESIFDLDDTDQFGRPIPGLFAKAQEAMRAAQKQQQLQQQQQQQQEQQQQQQEQPSKRNSDMTSSLSGQSGVTQSTGDTSVSAGLPQAPLQTKSQAGNEERRSPDAMQMMGIPGQDLAYQAALAEAAHKAAASGKFRRSSSPEVPSGLPDTPSTPSTDLIGSHLYSQPETRFGDYEDDGFGNDFDDLNFDDEAIIAEANASALANDSDGFYGQEFGFYSAPLPLPPYGNGGYGQGASGVRSTESVFQYANGGYFGPAGVGLSRSASGRVVSREPNLTPITERSEYSNRNSVMSFTTLPPALGGSGGAGSSEGRNSASASLASPGLAQLAALMPHDDDASSNMSLSALLKLRSRAWGGSQPSLASSREGSPRSERAMPVADVHCHPSAGLLAGAGLGHARVNSGLSTWSNPGGVGGGGGGGSGAGSGSGGASPGQANGGGRPASAGSAGAGLSASPCSSSHGVASPLPQRPHSLSSPASLYTAAAATPGLLQLAGAGGGVGGGTLCSPVLEGEEGDGEGVGDGGGGRDGCALAPALPVRAKSVVEGQKREGEGM